MANIIEITSLDAPELDVYLRLTEAQLRSRRRPEEGLFIAESVRVIGYGLDVGLEPVSFLMERKHIAGQAAGLIARCPEVPIYTADSEVLAELTGYHLSRGCLCAMRRPAEKTVEEVCRDARRIAVLEGITDSTNVGAIFRSAAALGVDGVLVTPTCCDPMNRRSVRVSMGSVFRVPWAMIGSSPKDWPGKGMEQLRALGFRTAALALSRESVSLGDPRLRTEERLAMLLGTEGDGLAKKTIASCDYTVMIPMYHEVDSLNVAAASAVAFWELCRKD